MILGALLASIAVGASVLGIRGQSGIARRLERIAPAPSASPRWHPLSDDLLRQAGVAIDAHRFFGIKIVTALATALLIEAVSLVLPIGTAIAIVGAYAGFVAPSVLVERRAASRRAESERELVVLVEQLEALVAAGRPVETALALLAKRGSGAPILDRALRRTADTYALGASLFGALRASALLEGLAACAALAEDLERARGLGMGSLATIRERRASLRAGERARALAAASEVEGKLMLVLVLCYLPALALLVVIPLFVGLLQGLFG